jgi:hypothetical protein
MTGVPRERPSAPRGGQALTAVDVPARTDPATNGFSGHGPIQRTAHQKEASSP